MQCGWHLDKGTIILGALLLTLFRLTLALNAHGGFCFCTLVPDVILFLLYLGLAKRLSGTLEFYAKLGGGLQPSLICTNGSNK